MTTSGFYLNKSIRSVTSNGKLSDTGSLKRTQTTYRHKENSFLEDGMTERQLPTYGINTKKTEITKS
jgi:hypothetical protein